ncbi:MAG: hypothetical protein ACSNEK_06815 [Parachlamydiaceae bacterium]
MSFAGSVTGSNPNANCEKKTIQPHLIEDKNWHTIEALDKTCQLSWEGEILKVNLSEYEESCDGTCTLSMIKNHELSYDLLIDRSGRSLTKAIRIDLKDYAKSGAVFRVLLMGPNKTAYSLGEILF